MTGYEKQRTDNCPRCFGPRHSILNLKTGQAVASLPRLCRHRDKCEQEICPGFNPDALFANPALTASTKDKE